MRITDCNLEIQIHYESASIQSKTHSENHLNYACNLLISALNFKPQWKKTQNGEWTTEFFCSFKRINLFFGIVINT